MDAAQRILARDPILKPLDTIECRDAILDNTEHWPEAESFGNPPFLGNRKTRGELGSDYVDMLERLLLWQTDLGY